MKSKVDSTLKLIYFDGNGY